MNYLLAISVLLISLTFAGCGEDQPAKIVSPDSSARGTTSSANANDQNPPRTQSIESSGGVVVTITPVNPIAGDCLLASVKGLSEGVFTWEVNGLNVQQNKSNRYCLEEVRRDDVVTVSVEDAAKGGNASVTVGNSLPRVLDSRLAFVEDNGEYFVEITPQIEDADGDYVELVYQWLINGQVNDTYTDNRMPSNAYLGGDTLQVKITPDDGYGTGRTYSSRQVNMQSAAPVITSQPPKSFEAMEYTYQVEATDVDSSELAFSLVDAPEGMTIDVLTGMIVWPLAEVGAGEYQVKIVVTDPEGSTGGQTFTLDLAKHRVVKQEQQ